MSNIPMCLFGIIEIIELDSVGYVEKYFLPYTSTLNFRMSNILCTFRCLTYSLLFN